MSAGYTLLWPDENEGGETEKSFARYLDGLPADRRKVIFDAILSLEEDPRPSNSPGVLYFETKPEKIVHFLRMLPGIPVKGLPQVYNDILFGSHHMTVSGSTVVYAIDDKKRVFSKASG